jgi:hypothetical protein
MVWPLQVLNPNLCSSYIRKVKETKRTVIDLESDQLDSDQDKQEDKLSKKTRKTTTTKSTKKTAKTAKLTNQKKKPTASSSPIHSVVAIHPCPTSPPKPRPQNRSKLGHDNQPLRSLPLLPNSSYESWEFYLDNGGYKLTTDERISVKSFVKLKWSNPVASVAEGIKFHQLVKGMHAQRCNSPRDAFCFACQVSIQF